MLRLLRLVDQFSELERSLAGDWSGLRLQLTIGNEARLERAGALLAPATPGRSGRTLRFNVDRIGPGVAPEAVRRLLKRLDDERIEGELELSAVQQERREERRQKQTFRRQWEQQLAGAPPDW
ncbi:MAG: hypothetical protein QOD85_1480, partial [Gaiellaceae bacterium]|nr:hypothetical protein [Gaiellaceae bacterium]